MTANDYNDGTGKKAESESSANENASSQPGVRSATQTRRGITRSAIQARGGVISGRVLTVLVVSTVLALLAMVVAFVLS